MSDNVDYRRIHTWGIEDSTTMCAGLFAGNHAAAVREAFKLCEYKSAPVTVYRVEGGEWIKEDVVTP
jgi:hypothetical protein